MKNIKTLTNNKTIDKGGDRKRTASVGLTQSDTFTALENLQESQRLPSINAINLNYFGIEQCLPGYSFGPFRRTSYLLHFVKSGKGVLQKNGDLYPVGKGQVFLIYPGEETTYRADEDDPWLYAWIGFTGLRAEDMMQHAGFSSTHPVLTCQNMDDIMETISSLLTVKELTYVNELMRMGYLYRIMALLICDNEQLDETDLTQEDTDKLYVRTAINLLTSPDHPQIKVGDVARAIGISRGYLTALFKKETGLSPQEYQINFRMEKAGDMLRSTENPVSAIAEELGYVDVLSFSKSFRRHFGVSPSAFRRQKVVIIRENEKGKYISGNPL